MACSRCSARSRADESVSACTKRSSPPPRFAGWTSGTTSMARSSADTRAHPSFLKMASVRADLTRAGEYARLLASVGINGCAINNVNAESADSRRRAFFRNSRASPMCFVPGACGCPSPSTSAARRSSAAWTRSIRSIRASPNGGRKRWTRFTGRFRILADSWSRPIRKAARARQPMAARLPMPPT